MRSKFNKRQLILALLFMATIWLCPNLAQAQSIEPSFTWTTPARFGLDADEDGLIDYFTTSESISPPSWTIDVDACANESTDSTLLYRWSVIVQPPELVEADTPLRQAQPTERSERIGWSGFKIDDLETDSCATNLEFPAQGSYDVTLTILTDQGEERSTTQIITVRDWLIVSLGDSYASGDGAPDRGLGLSGLIKWQDADYHRSANAGPAVAARLLEEEDAKTSVTFVHLARSNAHMLHDDPERTDLNISTQISQSVSLIGDRQIDGLLLSIGGNDAGFARLVKTCMALAPCHEVEFELIEDGLATAICEPVLGWTGVLEPLKDLCLEQAADIDADIRHFTANWTKNAAEIFAERTEPIPARYDDLAESLQQLNIRANGVYIVEYASPTRQDSGEFCPQSNRGNNLPGFSEDEFEWAEEELLNQLNQTVADAAQRNGWTYVGNVAQGFDAHGYCANENWIVRIPQSLRTQLDLSGTLHPTAAGYNYTGERIMGHLSEDLLPTDFALYVPIIVGYAINRQP